VSVIPTLSAAEGEESLPGQLSPGRDASTPNEFASRSRSETQHDNAKVGHAITNETAPRWPKTTTFG